MKITLEIPNGLCGCFLTGFVQTYPGLRLVCYPLDSDDLHDGAEIKLPWEEQKQ